MIDRIDNCLDSFWGAVLHWLTKRFKQTNLEVAYRTFWISLILCVGSCNPFIAVPMIMMAIFWFLPRVRLYQEVTSQGPGITIHIPSRDFNIAICVRIVAMSNFIVTTMCAVCGGSFWWAFALLAASSLCYSAACYFMFHTHCEQHTDPS